MTTPAPTEPAACDVEGCPRKAETRDWCKSHYTRWLRTGSPIANGRPMPPAELVRLRRLVGLPDTGPTPEMVDRWRVEEAFTEATA